MTLVIEETKGSKSDRLSELLKTPRITNRHDVWLWLYLYCVKRIDLLPETCNGHSMRDEIADKLASLPRIVSRLNALKDQYLVPDDHLAWITNEERQQAWLWRELNRNEVMHLPASLVHLTGRDEVIARLDIWDVDLGRKTRTINTLHRDWLRHTERDADFEWFKDKKEGEARCSCAWQWLKNKRSDLCSERVPFTSYTELLIFFDRVQLEPYEQKDVLKKVMQDWARKQHNERNKDSKQVNVMLTMHTISQLDRLAKQHGMSRAKVVAKLIGKESELGLYLDE